MYLSITSNKDNIDEIPDEQKNCCYFCESKINLSKTLYNKKFISCCFLCHIIVNFEKSHIYHGVLCHTNLSQSEIIHKTWEFFFEKNYVPLPIEIDPNAKRVNISSYLFANFEKKSNFSYGFFFTNKIHKMLIDELDELDEIFSSNKKSKKYDLLDYFNIEKYEISEDEKEKINKELNKLMNKNYSIMLETENILKERYIKLDN